MNGSKRYKTQILPLAVILLVGFAFVVLMNFNEASAESLRAAILIGIIGISLLLFVSGNSYVEIEDNVFRQREWFVFSKTINLNDLRSVENNPKYRWVFGYTGYILLFTSNSSKPAIALHTNSYSQKVMKEMLTDLKEKNPDILFDERVKEIKNGKTIK